MKTYSVEIKVTGKYEIQISANSRSEAMELAMLKMAGNTLWAEVLNDVYQDIVLIHATSQD